MINIKSLSIVAVVTRSEVIDCTDYIPWTTGTVGNPPTGGIWKAYKDSKGYQATTWVDAGNVPGSTSPGEWSPWSYIGDCKSGTMGSGMDGPGTIDCSDVHAWSPYIVYADPDTAVYSDNIKYQSKWWTNGDKPETSADSPWEMIGKCVDGTNTLGPEQDVTLPGQDLLDLTCACCIGCGSIQNGQVVCRSDTQDHCYYKWCDIGLQDQAKCDQLKGQSRFAWWSGQMPPSKPSWPAQVYAPYIDGGLYGWPPITDLATQYGTKHFIIAFAVSASLPQLQTGKCLAAFAGAIPLETGPTWEHDGNLYYLYDELKKLREQGGDFVISFGGASGVELSDAPECQQGDAVSNLVAEYTRFLEFTNSERIDFDIEGNAYGSSNSEKGWFYRFEAVKRIKQQKPNLHVTWTLPILPTGLTDDGMAFVNQMMTQGAPVNIINVMNMDYGACPTMCDPALIDKCEKDAMDALAGQVFTAAKQANRLSEFGWSSSDDVWPHLGSTPMIGMNDFDCLVYRFEDFNKNLPYWKQKKLGLLSNWSLGRDHPCADTYVATDCSSNPGQTEDYQYLKTFSAFNSE